MSESSFDDTILDGSDVDTSCVSSGEGEADPSGLLGLGGVDEPLIAALDNVIESNITDTVSLVDAEGGEKHLVPIEAKEDSQPNVETVSMASVGPEGQGPEDFPGSLTFDPAISWNTVTSHLTGLVGPSLETARDQINFTVQGMQQLPTPVNQPTPEGPAQETSGGTCATQGSLFKGKVKGGNPGQVMFRNTDIRTKGRYNRDNVWVPPALRSNPVTSGTTTAFRPPRVGDTMIPECDEEEEAVDGEDEDLEGDRSESVAVATVGNEESDDDAEFATPTNSPPRGNKQGQLTSVKQVELTDAQRAKRKRKASRQKQKRAEIRAAAARLKARLELEAPMVQSGPGLAQEVASQGSKLKRSAVPPATILSKRSRVDTSPQALGLAQYLRGVSPLAEPHQGALLSPLYRHGPVSAKALKSFANYSARRPPIEDEPSQGHRSQVLFDDAGLLMLELDPSNLLVGPATASVEQRAGEHLQGRLLFHSSTLLSYGRRIVRGSDYQCSLCQSLHFPQSKSLVVLMTGSEAIASAGLPFNIRNANIVSDDIPWTHQTQCWDTLLVSGELRSDPYKVAQGVYGSFQGDLCFILDMGAQPVEHGEGASSVIRRLSELVRKLVHDLRPGNWKGRTRVLVLPPLQHIGAGGQALVLNQRPSGPHSLLISSQLNELKGFIDLRNCEALQNGDRNTPLHSWSNLFSVLKHEQSRDSMNRVVSKAKVVVSPGVVEDNGYLCLHPNYLFNCICNLVTFVGNHPWCSW